MPRYDDYPKHTVDCWQSALVVVNELKQLYARTTGAVPEEFIKTQHVLEQLASFQHPRLYHFIHLLPH